MPPSVAFSSARPALGTLDEQADESPAGRLADRAKAWVERSCAEQGVPVKLSDPVALQRIADILIEGRKARSGTARKGTRAG